VLVAAAMALAAGLVAPVARADTAACIAANEQALTLRKQGKLRDALQQLALCADASCPAEVAAECSRQIDEVKALVPTLILAATDGTGNDLSDVKVSMDGAPLATILDGRPIPLDPGEHTFTFEVQGQAPVNKTLVIREGDRDRRESVVIGAPPPVPPAPFRPSGPREEPSMWTTRRLIAAIAAGVGVVGVGFGAGWGAYAISSQNREKSDCSAQRCSNPAQATEDYNTAKQDATASTIALVAGAVLVAGGAVLWFTAPSPESMVPVGHTLGVAPTVAGHNGGGLLLVGSFR
jgi:hypothetical protein